MDPVAAAEALTRATGEQVVFERALVGGVTGAHLFADGEGERLVIKWVDDPGAIGRRRHGVEISERLRLEAGWPTPERWCVEADDWLFVLQRFVPGEAMTSVDAAAVDDLLALHERRLGSGATDPAGGFAEHLLLTLRVGTDGYCLHEPLRTFDDRGRRFVERVEEIGAQLTVADLPAEDLIHWDLHVGNLIGADGRLVGIIDTDHAMVGDAAVDLVALALSAAEVGSSQADRLQEAAVAGLDDARLGAYAGHMILRFADWAVRLDQPAEADFWLDLADSWLP